jgi:hypothetical protein
MRVGSNERMLPFSDAGVRGYELRPERALLRLDRGLDSPTLEEGRRLMRGTKP